ncbi:hypothetical protein [Bradyrhizobium guangdongense]|uniref:hypothetical protein n=1 Tax=Bradyrhizobium guangdongense TaxID=1325090 RepID=UPI003D9AABE9
MAAVGQKPPLITGGCVGGRARPARMPAETFRRRFLIAMILLGVYLMGSAVLKGFG